MNLSDPSDEESSNDECPVSRKRALVDTPSDDESSNDKCSVSRKRARIDTYGASSTTSHGSARQESDDETPNTSHANYSGAEQFKNKLSYGGNSSNDDVRRSRSSLSENGSSPNDQYGDYRPGFEDNDNETSVRASFHDTSENTFYNKSIGQDGQNNNSFESGYSEMSKRMMSNMGFTPGKGLGKFEHGRVEPVEASTQKGRRGLGSKPSIVGQVPQDFKWSPDDAKAEAKEEVSWMPSAPEEPLSGDVLEKWLKKGPKKLTITDETEFVEPRILKGVLDAKTIFDSLDDEDLRHARFRSNPYETIGSVIFLNRAAVKMANMDAVFDFMFTEPKKANGESAIDKRGILYFADVCAGPGGFSEYVLYRKGWKAKGFGFTLKGGNDFKLSDFYAGTPETFNPFYGTKDDGNIFDSDNLTSLKDHVLKQTGDEGVHFLMADGGFSVEGQENIQEILSKQLYLCQCLAALMLVRTGGHFVVKLFDVFTMFSVGLIYIMYRCFDKVCIHKPVTSRPANSERYLICKYKRLGTEPAAQHLFQVNKILNKAVDSGKDVTELVPLSIIQEDTEFYDYIYRSNCVLGERQIKNLLKIAAFSKDRSLKDDCQAEMREECLKLWHLPDKVRTQPERLGPDDTLKSILSLVKPQPPDAHKPQDFKSNVLNKPPTCLEHPSKLDVFKNVYDWHFTFLSNTKNDPCVKIFLGCGGKQVYQLDDNGWRNVPELFRTIPAKTLIYGEIVKEYKGEGNNQIFSKALHIVDGMVLGGVDISHMTLSDRITQCDLFCTALNKPFNTESIAIRCKRFFNMEQFANVAINLRCRAMKRIKKAVTYDTPNKINGNGMYYTVGAVLFIKEIKDPWVAQISKKSGYKYYFMMGKDGKPRSEYFIPVGARLDMISGYMSRVMWPWDEAACAILEGTTREGVISCKDMENYVSGNVKKS